MKHHIVYVPGIGDNIGHVQSAAVHLWRLHGVQGHFHAMPWEGRESYGPKFNRLLGLIDHLAESGHSVSLVGASAGGSAVLDAYLERRDKISGVVLICPKVNHPETVSQHTYDQNLAFKEALLRLQPGLPKLTATDKAKMRTYYSPVDRTVVYADSKIDGIEEVRLPSLKHSYAIVYAITAGAGNLLGFLKSINRSK